MKKPYPYTARTSKVVCEDCGRPLKKNVVERKSKKNQPKYCYRHYKERRIAHAHNHHRDV